MTESAGIFRARPGDDPATVERINRMADTIRTVSSAGVKCDAMVEEFMREIRRAMRRGLLQGADEIIDELGDPFYEEDERDD